MKPRAVSLRLRLLSLLLAGLVLASSVGLAAERHRCRISGRSTVALLLPSLPTAPAADAPANQSPAPATQRSAQTKPGRPCEKRPARRRAAGCCDVSHVLHKLDAKSHAGPAAKLLPAPSLLSPALLPVPAWAGPVAVAALPAAVAVGAAANSSPPGAPRAGRALLAFVCTLVV